MSLIPIWAKALIVAALLAALAWGVHLYNQSIRDTQRALDVAEYNVKLVQAEEKARAKESQWQAQIKGAQDEAQKLRNDKELADKSNRVVVGRLREQLANISNSLSSTSITACRARASTLTIVFEQCVQRYSDMGKYAQGQYVDSVTCQAAWPK